MLQTYDGAPPTFCGQSILTDSSGRMAAPALFQHGVQLFGKNDEA